MRSAILLSLALLAPSVAHANLFDVFGAGARASGMSGAVGAITEDAMAVYHNPAGLPDAQRALSFGVVGTFDRTAILLMPRPAGYDPPAYDLRLSPRSDTENPAGQVGLTVGLVLKLFDEDLALGAVLMMPTEGFAGAATTFADEREQYFSNRLRFELLGHRTETEVIATALGYRLTDWLSMGIGLLILPENQTITAAYTPNAAEPSYVDLNVKLEQSARRALTAGAIAKPWPWLKLGLSFQDEVFFRVQGYNDVQLRGEETKDPERQLIDLVEHYSPPRISGSAAYVSPEGLIVSLEGTWHAWSRYLDNHGENPGFNDTLDWKAGVEYPAGKTKVRAGASFTPTPIPTQDGRTNYVDNDRFGLSAGLGRDFTVWEQPLTVDFAVQLQSLIESTTHKAKVEGRYPACAPGVAGLCDEVPDLDQDTPLQSARETHGLQTGNPGFPGYTHGGYVLAAGVDLTWRF